MPFYAVAVGRKPGIYEKWEECLDQVHCFAGAQYKGFSTRSQAEAYLCTNLQLHHQNNNTPMTTSSSSNDQHQHLPSSSPLAATTTTTPFKSPPRDVVDEPNSKRPKVLVASQENKRNAASSSSSTPKKMTNPYAAAATSSTSKKTTTEAMQQQQQSTHTRVVEDLTADESDHAPFQPYHWQQRQQRQNNNNNNNATSKDQRKRRIPDVFAENLSQAMARATISSSSSSLSDDPTTNHFQKRMEGDVNKLAVKSFFVNGVKIGWPYPSISQPQRMMALHLIQALKRQLHVVLESPTGTGKSAALLCSVLAWQRYHAKLAGVGSSSSSASPQIIYCSRTHSQVAQMVASLRQTPYRPRMTVLGSRDRLCIHEDIRKPLHEAATNNNRRSNNNQSRKARMPANLACQIRIKHTERQRKMDSLYDDDDPPTVMETDSIATALSGRRRSSDDGNGDNEEGDGHDEDDDSTNAVTVTLEASTSSSSSQKKKYTCPHYRQLTTTRTAEMVQTRFAPTAATISCCQVGGGGGAKTKLGSLDIEDLVAFGTNPHIVRQVAIYRQPPVPSNDKTNNAQPQELLSFGFSLQAGPEGVYCQSLAAGSAVALEGTIQVGDQILSVNGQDMRHQQLDTVVQAFSNSSDPALVDILRRGGQLEQQQQPMDGEEGTNHNDGYDNDDMMTRSSQHSACPYYISRALAKKAELIFAPYNYILDPQIRRAMGIKVEDAVVIIDEGHNVEGTLREAGSDKFGEFELCDMIIQLLGNARRHNPYREDDDMVQREGLPEMSHDLLMFLERVVLFMRQCRDSFERNPGNAGAEAAIREYKKFRTPDDKCFEIRYFGPSGAGGKGGKPVGCKPFFEMFFESGILPSGKFEQYAGVIGENSGQSGDDEESNKAYEQNDRLVDLLTKFALAMRSPEHFYFSVSARANGSLSHVAGESSGESPVRFRKNPKALPKRTPELCHFESCVSNGTGTCHGEVCDGTIPKWEIVLELELLTPSLLLQPVADSCRNLILASGSLAPLGSLCAELGLTPASDDAHKFRRPEEMLKAEAALDTDDFSPPIKGEEPPSTPTRNAMALIGAKPMGRLQVKPPPLEADHVINLPKQLRAISIGSFPDGSPLTVTYSNYKKPGFYQRLGHAIASVAEAVPRGGVLVFFPSYSFLRNCVKCWKGNNTTYSFSRFDGADSDPEIWRRFVDSKSTVVVEPTGSQTDFEAAKKQFTDSIQTHGKAILLAVFRGKMSEGISFNDDNARAVICVGLPFPNSFDRTIKSKKLYNDEQRKLRHNTSLLPGGEWYSQQAYRAIAQALGRCIRHAGDYGTVILMDSRHCDDGSPNIDGICRAHRNLPKWLRTSVRNLSMSDYASHYQTSPTIVGGYAGLANELSVFFDEAAPYARGVLQKFQDDFALARERMANVQHSFDQSTGTWVQKKTTTS